MCGQISICVSTQLEEWSDMLISQAVIYYSAWMEKKKEVQYVNKFLSVLRDWSAIVGVTSMHRVLDLGSKPVD